MVGSARHSYAQAQVTDHEGDCFESGTILDFCLSKPEASEDASSTSQPLAGQPTAAESESLWFVEYREDDRSQVALKEHDDKVYLACFDPGDGLEISMSTDPYWWSVHHGAALGSFILGTPQGSFIRAWEGEDPSEIDIAFCAQPYVEHEPLKDGLESVKEWIASSWVFRASPRYSAWKLAKQKARASAEVPESSRLSRSDSMVSSVLPSCTPGSAMATRPLEEALRLSTKLSPRAQALRSKRCRPIHPSRQFFWSPELLRRFEAGKTSDQWPERLPAPMTRPARRLPADAPPARRLPAKIPPARCRPDETPPAQLPPTQIKPQRLLDWSPDLLERLGSGSVQSEF